MFVAVLWSSTDMHAVYNGKEALTKLKRYPIRRRFKYFTTMGKDTFNELVAITRPNFLY